MPSLLSEIVEGSVVDVVVVVVVAVAFDVVVDCPSDMLSLGPLFLFLFQFSKIDCKKFGGCDESEAEARYVAVVTVVIAVVVETVVVDVVVVTDVGDVDNEKIWLVSSVALASSSSSLSLEDEKISILESSFLLLFSKRE